MQIISKELAATRPTAVNLFWALERMEKVVESKQTEPVPSIVDALIQEAEAIATEDIETCKQIGAAGALLIADGDGVLTICNAGALATVVVALGVVRAANDVVKFSCIYCGDRPFLQGARLTAGN